MSSGFTGPDFGELNAYSGFRNCLHMFQDIAGIWINSKQGIPADSQGSVN